MKHRVNRMVAATILGVGLVTGSYAPAYAAPAWSLPAQGVQLDRAAKQAYVTDRMYTAFHKAQKTAPAAFTAPDGWSYTQITEKGVKIEKLVNPQGSPARTVLQLHGGGYIAPLTNAYRHIAVQQAVLANARETYMVDYKLAPEYKYPAALDDALTAYTFIVKEGIRPQDIIVFGDSAGGNLALAMSQKLRDEHVPQPGLLILDSPWATAETQSPSRQNHVDQDMVLGKINEAMFREINAPSFVPKGMKLSDPRISPLHGDLTGLPPMLIQAGGYELFLDEAIELAQKAAAAGVKVTLTVYPAMSHDFALCIPELQDSVDSFAEIRDFVNANMK